MKHNSPSLMERPLETQGSRPQFNRKLKSTCVALLAGLVASVGLASAQTTILATQAGGGALPSGWVGQNNVTANAIDRTSYWLVEAGATKDFIVSGNYDLSGFSSITVNVNVATFGSGANNPLLIEYSTDGGTSWSATTYTSATPTTTTYITGGPIVISQTFTSTTKLRFSTATTSGKGVRIQQLGITGLSLGGDTTPPAILSRIPTVGATDVSVETAISITFDEPIQLGAGGVQLYREEGASDVLIPISSLNINGNTASFSPLAFLDNSETYYVLIDNNAILDTASPTPNAFPGIAGETSWTFTTIAPDTAGPVATVFVPSNGTSNIDPDADLKITFDELVLQGSGDILIKKVSDNSTVATLDVTNNALVSVLNNEAFLNPSVSLPPNTALYVEVPAGAFTDALSNPSLAIGGAGVWSFTTRVIPDLTLSGYTQDFTGFSAASPTLPDGWTLTGPVTTFNTNTADQTWGSGTGSGLRGPDLLGFQHTGSTGILVKTLTLVNATGAEITELTVSYLGRGARLTESRKPAYTVSVAGVSVGGLGYSTNDGDMQSRSVGIPGLSIPAGNTFTITWTSDANVGTTGSRCQIGVDDVSVSVGIQEFPPTVSSVALGYDTLSQTGIDIASEVTADGGAALTGRGFVYAPVSANSNPEIGGTAVTQVADTVAAVGPMNASLTGLLPFTTYIVRSYAINVEGTSYSTGSTFTTLAQNPLFGGSFTESFDGFTGSIVTGGLPAGWKVLSSGGVNGYAGTWGPSTSAGGLVGDVSNPGVLGYQHVTTSGVATVTLSLVNDTGSTISQLYVSYLGRVERATETRSPEWTVSVDGAPVTQLAYSTAGGVDETKSHLVTGLSIANGATFTITWESDANVGTGGARRQIGIEDVSVALEAPAGYAAWATTNAGGQTADLDFDNDGVPNGVEFFMNAAAGFTANPGLVSGTVTWPNGGNLAPGDYGTKFKVQTSTNLSNWTDVQPSDPNLSNTSGFLSYSAFAPAPFFVRLVVTP